jgi:hypothetical protein
MSNCSQCGGTGVFSYECRYCCGSGIIKKDSGVVTCGYCFGSGRFYPQYKQKKDTKLKTFSLPFKIFELSNGKKIFAYKCTKCRGTGK